MTRLIFIRAANPSERELLEALMERAGRAAAEFCGVPEPPRAAPIDSARIAQGHVLIAEAAGAILGFAMWSSCGEDVAEIETVAVEPEHWRQGNGRRLIEAVAASAGETRLRATSGPGETEFFLRCGFRKLARVQTPSGTAFRLEQRTRAQDEQSAD